MLVVAVVVLIINVVTIGCGSSAGVIVLFIQRSREEVQQQRVGRQTALQRY